MLTFTKQNHEYRYEGVVIPSVSEILSGAGLSNFSMVNRRMLEIAQERGENVHLACEYYDRGILDESTVDPDLAGYVDGWKAFVADYKPKFKMIEEKLCNLDLWFAGTMDRVATIKCKQTIIDIKTGVKSKAHEVQLGAYSFFKEMKNVKAAWTVYLSKTGKYTIEVHDLERGRKVFLSALTLHKYKNKV